MLADRYSVSVAMITYNGVSYIEEQLTSILNQTVKPDEVIISDDGSTDGSIELIKGIIENYIDSGIRIVLLTDNPIHGIGHNYTWAVQHAKGDIIFSSGQDDVWAKDKIEKILNVYKKHDDAQVVITNADLIDGQGMPYDGKFCYDFIRSLNVKKGDSIKVQRSKYIYRADNPVVSGPVLSFKASIKDLVIPIPAFTFEDQVIEFVGLVEDSLYYLEEKLTIYRIHDSTCNTKNVTLFRRLQKEKNRIKHSYTIPFNMYFFGKMMLLYYKTHPDDFEGRDAAIDTVNHIISIGEREISYMRMGRIKGAYNLSKMYHTDIRYQKSGRQAHIISLLYILMYSKKKRNQDIDNELAKSKT